MIERKGFNLIVAFYSQPCCTLHNANAAVLKPSKDKYVES